MIRQMTYGEPCTYGGECTEAAEYQMVLTTRPGAEPRDLDEMTRGACNAHVLPLLGSLTNYVSGWGEVDAVAVVRLQHAQPDHGSVRGLSHALARAGVI